MKQWKLAAACLAALGLAACSVADAQPAANPAPASTKPATRSAGSTPAGTPATTSRPPTKAPSSTKAPASKSPSKKPPVARQPVVQPPLGTQVDCKQVACVALTFDDGPGAKTPTLLKTLTDANAPATFFMMGNSVSIHQDTVRAIAATQGMEIANHTVSHPLLPGMSRSRIDWQIGTNESRLEALAGRPVTLFRPPYGGQNAAVRSSAAAHGEAIILWSVDTLDWKYRNTARVANVAVGQARPGAIILMHDIHATTVAAVPDIIKRLNAKGYTLVTVTTLLGQTVPGKVYTGR